MNNIDLEGRAAVVTGGADGIGRAITESLLISGARVAMWDIRQKNQDAMQEANDAISTIFEGKYTVDIKHSTPDILVVKNLETTSSKIKTAS